MRRDDKDVCDKGDKPRKRPVEERHRVLPEVVPPDARPEHVRVVAAAREARPARPAVPAARRATTPAVRARVRKREPVGVQVVVVNAVVKTVAVTAGIAVAVTIVTEDLIDAVPVGAVVGETGRGGLVPLRR